MLVDMRRSSKAEKCVLLKNGVARDTLDKLRALDAALKVRNLRMTISSKAFAMLSTLSDDYLKQMTNFTCLEILDVQVECRGDF